MIRFFKTTQPAALFSIPLIVIVLWGQRFLNFPVYNDSYSMPLWDMLQDVFLVLPSWLNLLVFCAIISLEAIYFNLLLNKHDVLYKNSYLPALCFVLFISSNPAFLVIHPVHLVNLILLRIFDKLFSFYKQNKAIASIFDCGFLAALAALLYFPAIPVLLLLMFALAMMRPFNVREWLVMLIGYLVPFMFLSVWNFWNHELHLFWKNFFAHFRAPVKAFQLPPSLALQFMGGVLLLLLLLSLFRLRKNYYKNIIRVRGYQQLQFLFFLLGLLSIYLSKELSWIHFGILAIPWALWFSYFLLSQKRKMWMAEGLLWLLIVAIVWNHVA